MTTIVELRGIGKSYQTTPVVHALQPVDLTIEAGDWLAVVGPSGSGKSTLLNLLGLLDRPTQGRYVFAGVDVSTLGERERTALRGRRIGFVFQQFHLLPHRTAVENVALALLYTTPSAGQRTTAAVQALRRVGLGHRLHALPSTMSGGERQRVAIARALVGAPDLVLCDEPTGNLDSANAHAVLDVLNDLNADGVTLIVITHDPDVAARARSRVHIRDGSVTSADPRSAPSATTAKAPA
ncbi:ABC transporter ATP-binding protein [Actinacidiphila paucisporea]|uniref:Putative ABC transport system ATP-binding protein n=1 Tax=Actinacidiphila paucisporea TaxID=310782 RepID=A0A1M7PY32_9ACTN|nr:ABC transporter ATP-binding protein [Actinacidiphila paucisporea]SHN22576.1 putative ABC transport system ATP-binding protein [Actinacidiphila paucisporea]